MGLTAWMVTCDRLFHVNTRTVVHFWTPQVGGQTVWVVLLFGLASSAFVTIAPRVPAESTSPLRFARELGIMTSIYAVSGWFGQDHATAVTAAFAALFVARFALHGSRRTIAGLALLLAVVGPAFESLQWSLGMFEYTHPDVLGVPWWLLAFYANGAWAVRELGALLLQRTPATATAALGRA